MRTATPTTTARAATDTNLLTRRLGAIALLAAVIGGAVLAGCGNP
jgi:hypothetical protein